MQITLKNIVAILLILANSSILKDNSCFFKFSLLSWNIQRNEANFESSCKTEARLVKRLNP